MPNIKEPLATISVNGVVIGKVRNFTLRAKVKISRREIDPNLPESFGPKEWWMLSPWSNLKHPKKWMHNKRLQKRFCKRRYCYLPMWVFNRYLTRGEKQIEDMYAKAVQQIME